MEIADGSDLSKSREPCAGVAADCGALTTDVPAGAGVTAEAAETPRDRGENCESEPSTFEKKLGATDDEPGAADDDELDDELEGVAPDKDADAADVAEGDPAGSAALLGALDEMPLKLDCDRPFRTRESAASASLSSSSTFCSSAEGLGFVSGFVSCGPSNTGPPLKSSNFVGATTLITPGSGRALYFAAMPSWMEISCSYVGFVKPS